MGPFCHRVRLAPSTNRICFGRKLCRWLLAFFVGSALLSGCSHKDMPDVPEPPLTGLMAPRPPVLLTGPAAFLVTNASGFSARVAASGTMAGELNEPGELLGLGTRLLFAPASDKPLDKHSPAGGFSFVWDVAEGSGFLMSEALQGYAPISSSARLTNMVSSPIEGSVQIFEGHPCRKEQVTLRMTDGRGAIVEVLKAADLGEFPLQITSTVRGSPLTITFSKVRLEPPPASLFSPPNSFTKYSSAEAMVDELALRQRNLKKRRY